MSRQVEDRLAALAGRQHGVVTHGQLLEAGLSADAIGRRLRAGKVRALHRGVYLALPIPLPHTREMAALLATGAGAVLSHRSAWALWGGSAAGKGPVDVTSENNRGRRPGIRLHRVRRLPADERAVCDGVGVTTPVRTLLDLAADLGALELEAAVARAEREGLVTRERLARILARHGRRTGASALRAILERAGGPALTRSEAEARFLDLAREAGLPPPECNVRIGRYEVDFLWRRARIAVEVDGFRFHASQARFEGDRRKDAELVAAGLTVLRLTWRQITEEPLATVARLAQALTRGSERPEVRALGQ